jgi:hypothetical protein
MARLATSNQMKCLKRMATERGVSFAYPKTFAEADAEIKRLIARNGNGRTFAELDVENRNAEKFDRTVRVTAHVRDCEITGYGSSATWR